MSSFISPTSALNTECTRMIYRQTSDTNGTLVGNNIVDHSDVVGASPVDAAPTTPSFPT